jgi:RNA polymerase sigma-70 factor (ECF subfamily)
MSVISVTVAAGSYFVPALREWVWMDHLTSLLTAARDGDRGALERFVAETQAEVWTMCRYLGDAGYADDLAQETYERAIGSLHRYRAEGSARGWLLTIARRVCVDHTRRAVRRRRLDRSVIHDTTAGWQGGGPSAPDASGRVELDELLGELDDDRRAAFVLTQVLGRHYDEAAEVLGCPVGTVRSRVSRARRDLVAKMAEAEDVASGTAGHADETSLPDLPPRRSAGGR